MSAQLFEDGLRALNRLVFAAEALEVHLPGKIPGYAGLADFEDEESEEAFTREKAVELGKRWQFLAVELACILGELELERFADDLAALHAKAKEARLALIQIDVYDPPVPGSP